MVLPHIGLGELHLKIGRLCYGSMLLTCFGHGFALWLFTNKLDLAHIQWCCLVTGYKTALPLPGIAHWCCHTNPREVYNYYPVTYFKTLTSSSVFT